MLISPAGRPHLRPSSSFLLMGIPTIPWRFYSEAVVYCISSTHAIFLGDFSIYVVDGWVGITYFSFFLLFFLVHWLHLLKTLFQILHISLTHELKELQAQLCASFILFHSPGKSSYSFGFNTTFQYGSQISSSLFIWFPGSKSN